MEYSSQYLLLLGTTDLRKKKQLSLIATVFILFKKFGLAVLCMSVTSHYQMKKINQSWLHFKM